MFNRWYIFAVLACWIASMSWLLVEKILPTLREGDRPQYSEVLPAPAAAPRYVCWRIEYRGKPIGQARSLSRREIDGSGKIESTVRFDNLPLSEIMSELVGNIVASLISNDKLLITMTVESEMDIGADGNLQSFVTDVRIANLASIIRVEGEVTGSKMQVTVFTTDDAGERQVRFRDEIELPNEAMVSDSLSPQDRLTALHEGQTWTVPVYRPFPPNSPVQMLQATVERQEVFIWNDNSLRAFQVVYREDAGSGITIAREPVGRMWVREDGVVLQQEARMANMVFRFIRLADEDCAGVD